MELNRALSLWAELVSLATRCQTINHVSKTIQLQRQKEASSGVSSDYLDGIFATIKVWYCSFKGRNLDWVKPSPFKIFIFLTKHIVLIALVGIRCMWQKFHTLLILTLHWNTRIMHLWLEINPFDCVTEKRKPIMWGGQSWIIALIKARSPKMGTCTRNHLRTRWREWWKVFCH